MRKYRTTISIINRGLDEFDAGEKAGMMMNGEMVKRGMNISCLPTRCVEAGGEDNTGFFHKRFGKKYITSIEIVCGAADIFEAADDANGLFSIADMAIGSSVIWEDTEPLGLDPLLALEEDVEAYMYV